MEKIEIVKGKSYWYSTVTSSCFLVTVDGFDNKFPDLVEVKNHNSEPYDNIIYLSISSLKTEPCNKCKQLFLNKIGMQDWTNKLPEQNEEKSGR